MVISAPARKNLALQISLLGLAAKGQLAPACAQGPTWGMGRPTSRLERSRDWAELGNRVQLKRKELIFLPFQPPSMAETGWSS